VRVHIVSDVHGAGQALARAAEGSDVFVCLGDLILFLDYDDPERGIYADLFGEDHARRYIGLRTANRFDEARALSHAAWERIGITDHDARYQVLESMVRVQYEELFDAMPTPAYLTYGNVDIPRLWSEYLRPGHTVVDKQVIQVDGQRWGFLGGGLVSPMRTPHEIDPEEYAQAVAQLGPVDVLFTHIPPAFPELTYDVVARRFEVGSTALRAYVEEHQPRYHFFGHVHQPLSARTRIGRTECVNVGHFHGREAPFAVDL
jgi:Icc-related predicted phosphoesterase